MPELDGVIGLILLGLWLYCIFDAITTPEGDVRNLPKGMWIILVIILPDIGSILWLIAGRPRTVAARNMPYKGNAGLDEPTRGGRSRSLAPDDDPSFLRQLKKSNDEHETMLNQWEADLRRREEQLRERPEEPGAGA